MFSPYGHGFHRFHLIKTFTFQRGSTLKNWINIRLSKLVVPTWLSGEEVCQRLSSFDSTVAARIINRPWTWTVSACGWHNLPFCPLLSPGKRNSHFACHLSRKDSRITCFDRSNSPLLHDFSFLSDGARNKKLPKNLRGIRRVTTMTIHLSF